MKNSIESMMIFYSILMSLLMERILTAKKSIFGIFII